MPFLARKRARIIPALLLLLASSLTASAQEPAKPRPKVALVLSGGGARGFAHIGVIEWLEEHRIPVDIVTGTTMGGLIARMYATRMNSVQAPHFITALQSGKSTRPA